MIKYIFLVLLGAISFGILTSFVKLAYQQSYHPAEVSFIQALLGAMVLWGIVFFSKTKGVVQTRDIILLLLTGTTIGISTFLYYLSVQYIPASVAIVLLMQFTWISMLIEWLIFRKKPSMLQVITAVVIMLGTCLASGLAMQEHLVLPVTGLVAVLLASVVYALYIVSNSRVGKTISWKNKSAWMMTGSATAILLVNLRTLPFSNHLDFGLLQWGILLALFGTVIPPVVFAIGMPKIGASTSGLLLTVELPMAVLSAHWILKENVSLTQLAGILMMLSAIVAMNLLNSRRRKSLGIDMHA